MSLSGLPRLWVSKASGMDRLFYMLGTPFVIPPFYSCDSSLSASLISGASSLPGRVLHLVAVTHLIAKHLKDLIPLL